MDRTDYDDRGTLESIVVSQNHFESTTTGSLANSEQQNISKSVWNEQFENGSLKTFTPPNVDEDDNSVNTLRNANPENPMRTLHLSEFSLTKPLYERNQRNCKSSKKLKLFFNGFRSPHCWCCAGQRNFAQQRR